MALQRQRLEQKQQLKQTVSMQTVQFMRLLEIPSNRLEDEIFKAVEENPALEIDYDAPVERHENDALEDPGSSEDPSLQELRGESTISDEAYDDFFDSDIRDNDYGYAMLPQQETLPFSLNRSKDDLYREPVAVNDLSLQDSLLSQLNMLDVSAEDKPIAEYLIGTLNDDGYVAQDLASIAMDLLLTYNIHTSERHLEQLLTRYIQQLDPPGVGARDLRECLLLQLHRLPDNPVTRQALAVIRDHFNEYSLKHYEKIKSQLPLDDKTFKEVVDLIQSLAPKPADNSTFQEEVSNYIIPDFIVSIAGGKPTLALNNDYLPRLRINKEHAEMLNFLKSEKNQKRRAEAEKYYKEHLDGASNFIHLLSQRELTMHNIMRAVMTRQEKFFITGDDRDIKPMILKDIADDLGIDISTVSRVTNNKYVLTPYGTFPVKRLFSESIGDEDVSSREVKAIIARLVEKEDKGLPLTDEKLCLALEKRGYKIARRTVAKYREQLNIPVARLRKGFMP